MENNNCQMPVAPEQKPSNGLAITSLVLGIASVILLFIPVPYLSYIAIVSAIVGIILAIVAKKKSPSGMATAGLVLSIIALVVCIIYIIAVAACASAVIGAIGGLVE